MPAITESAPLGPWQLLFWGVVLVCAVAATVLAARIHRTNGKADADASDPVFWDLFAGLAVVVPALVIPTLASPLAGLVLAIIACATAVAAYLGTPRVIRWLDNRQRRRQALPAVEAAAATHRRLLAAWQRYELDPALGIDYPDMTDVRRPETAALVRAMREAATLRTAHETGEYPPAVARLEQALAAAESAAGVAAHVSGVQAVGGVQAVLAGLPGSAAGPLPTQ
ncbi:hypothetical protein V3C33_19310 [Micrococcaceae bacterium Sec5.7]